MCAAEGVRPCDISQVNGKGVNTINNIQESGDLLRIRKSGDLFIMANSSLHSSGVSAVLTPLKNTRPAKLQSGVAKFTIKETGAYSVQLRFLDASTGTTKTCSIVSNLTVRCSRGYRPHGTACIRQCESGYTEKDDKCVSVSIFTNSTARLVMVVLVGLTIVVLVGLMLVCFCRPRTLQLYCKRRVRAYQQLMLASTEFAIASSIESRVCPLSQQSGHGRSAGKAYKLLTRWNSRWKLRRKAQAGGDVELAILSENISVAELQGSFGSAVDALQQKGSCQRYNGLHCAAICNAHPMIVRSMLEVAPKLVAEKTLNGKDAVQLSAGSRPPARPHTRTQRARARRTHKHKPARAQERCRVCS